MAEVQHSPALTASVNPVITYLLGPSRVAGLLQHNVLVFLMLVTSVD